MPFEPLQAEFHLRGEAAKREIERAGKRYGYALLVELVHHTDATRRLVASTRDELHAARRALEDAQAAFLAFAAYDLVTNKRGFDPDLVDLLENPGGAVGASEEVNV